MSLSEGYSLADRYTRDSGRVFLTGVQALARIPIEQLRIDRASGLNTAAFVSGYPGSPLGGFDQEIARAAAMVDDLPIVCRPTVNEEFGATAVMGSQLAAEQPDFRYDGVLGIWYGKAPGLDRAGDALRHAQFAGTSRHGGAVALIGDDPAAKSSTLPSSSDATANDLHMPLLYPGDVQEVVDLGRHAVALSRLTGVWTSLKIVAAVADGNGTVDLGLDRVVPVVPDLSAPGSSDGAPHIHHPNGVLLTPYTLELERDFKEVRSVLVQRYATANRLNHVTVDAPDAWIGLVASGYTYHEMLEALARLGLDSDTAIAKAGIRLIKMQIPLSIDPDNIRNFARGLDEIVIIEEKNPTLEWLVKNALYGSSHQPRVVGKAHEDGRTLMRSHGILDAGAIIDGLRERLSAKLADHLAPIPPPRDHRLIPLTVERKPFFCSGCPHNRSTQVSDDALVGAGIGCHGMVLLMDEDKVGESAGLASMGNEGVQWIGMSPFLDRDHFVQNLGDGTFFHSGQLAIQASIAAGVNVTYKLLYNGTVAMTGGQDAVGGVGVPEIATILLNHGASEVLVTTDDVGAYRGVDLPEGPTGRVKVWDRSRILEAQRHLATVPGTTVMIHDQPCAAQQRRQRKRGKVETPSFRVVINHRICEACGDCGDISNCLSVQAVETPLGVKTTIDQSSCNYDFSCMEGDCPSFMTVEVETHPTTSASQLDTVTDIPTPVLRGDPDRVDLRMIGIGGTGVVTAAQIIATAAMLDGFDVRGLDQTGLSQKAGPVVGDLRLRRGAPAPSNLIGEGGADLVLAFDLLGGSGERAVAVADPARTALVASTSETPTGSMIGHPDIDYPALDELRERVERRTTGDNVFLDTSGITERLFGSTATANTMLLGAAVQAGTIPVDPATIERAIELNGVAVETNQAAFRHGRLWVVDPDAFDTPRQGTPQLGSAPQMWVPALPRVATGRIAELAAPAEVSRLLELLAADLVGYQNTDLAMSYLDVVGRVWTAERSVSDDSSLTEAVARGLHKLMAYKDEYEVARLLTGPDAKAAAVAVGGRRPKITWRLHPPVLRALGKKAKMQLPARFARPAMVMLAAGKRLRGTRLDPFGYTKLRRAERDLVSEYRAALEILLTDLGEQHLEQAITLAELPMAVRGYEDIKLRAIYTMRNRLAELTR